MRRVLRSLGVVLLLAALVTSCLPAPNASAAYNAANLINDDVFLNKAAMSASAIQTFLESKNSGLATYKDVEDCGSTTGSNYSYYDRYYDCGKSVLASKIIYDSAQAYGINPQVIIATLQKEQSLITTPNPTDSQVDCAMGYSSCSKYPTFFLQVDNGTWQFRTYVERLYGHTWWGLSPSSYPCTGAGYITAYNSSGSKVSMRVYSTTLAPGNTVTFDNPTVYNSSGSITGGKNPPVPKTFKIASAATAGLYCYTPYVGPYSETGYSGSYNFVVNFENWFGSTHQSIIKDTYNFEKLAGPSGAVLPVSSSSLGSYTQTIADGSKIHEFYYDDTNNSLDYALWDGTRWSNKVIDGTGAATPGHTTHDVGKGISTTLWNGNLQVYYYDATNGDLRHAWMTPDGWHTETMDGASNSLGGFNADVGKFSTVTIWNDQLQLYYYDATNGNLRHTWWPGDGRWHFETMDGTTSSLGKLNADVGSSATALVWKSQLQLYYYDATNGNLRHTWWPGDGRWHFETMDGTTSSLAGLNANVGQDPAVTIWNDQLQLYYYDATNGNLRHTWWPGDGRWHFETMDGTATSVIGNDANVGQSTVIQQFQNDLFVFYYSVTEQSWRTTYWDGTWHYFNLDGGTAPMSGSSSPVSGKLSAAVYQGDSLQIFYKGASGNLEHAWANR